MIYKLIIHISGPSGSGKTFMGYRIKEKLGDKVIVADLDDLLSEFVMIKEKSKQATSDILDTWEKDYQQYINDYIEKQEKPIVFVGLNTNLGSIDFRNKKITPPQAFYDIPADYKFYIDLAINEILEQKFNRQVTEMSNNKEKYFKNWLKSPNKTQDKINSDININLWKNETIKLNKLYKSKRYTFATRDDIFNFVYKIIKNNMSIISVFYDDYSNLNELFDEIYKSKKSDYIYVSHSDLYKEKYSKIVSPQNQEKIRKLILDTKKIINDTSFAINPARYYVEFHKYFVNGKTKPFFGFHQDDGGAVPYKTVTCIYYLTKNDTIEGGDLEFKNKKVIDIKQNMLVIFNGNLKYRETPMDGNGILKSIVIQFERLT
jgi:adenylate kinase family enzyme